ncbi:hypothetical protein BCR42DRAFT_447698 [Absidia repens]|uniref:BZIP domain-containing protein n=1 Tax=Absidia repens TaxID=90262 RepID=A0A1X2IUA7_9FUNG|nr:hypothetical protein BCR42DRAFT_447698 [Absidia repens]
MSDIDMDMEMEMDMDDIPTSPSHSVDPHEQQPQDQPVKIRKKPGRKPNPASPALRKAQNRAAQRAFRERKERHMRELEVAIKQIREQRDKLYLENEQLKADAEINKSENWYLKGIVLTLQLVCYQHNLAIPQHGPFVNDQALSVMAQSTPEPIAAYLNVNANSKLPAPTQLSGYRHSIKQRDRYLSSGSIVVTKDDVCQQQFPALQPMSHPLQQYQQPQPQQTEIAFAPQSLSPPSDSHNNPTFNNNVHPLHTGNTSSSLSATSVSSPPYQDKHKTNERFSPEKGDDDHLAMPSLSPMEQPMLDHVMSIPRPPQNEPITSNLAAIQTLRLRLRLQSACARMDSVPFSIQPSILQLTIPHDPRIDLIPTPHMRDRMILFREQFDLDDCFKCLLSASVFHGGDPAIAANWQLPKVFFEKYWFLTIDYTLRRTTNRWRRLQGLNELENDFAKGDDDVIISTATAAENQKSEMEKDNDEDVDLTKRQKQDDKTTSWASDPTTLSSEDSAALAGLPALETQQSKQPPNTAVLPNTLESGFGIADLSSYLGVEFSKLEQMQQQQKQHDGGRFNRQAHPIPPDMSTSPLQHPPDLHKHHDNDSFEPVRLTNGYLLPQKSKNSTMNTPAPNIVSNSTVTSSPPHPSSLPTSAATATTLGNTLMPSESLPDKPSSLQHIQDPWEKMLLDSNHSGYDMLVNSFLHSDPHTS